MDGLNISTLPSPTNRYQLDILLGSGIFGQVHKALDTQAAGKAVAVKIHTHTDETEHHIQEEYKILRDFTQHANLVDFYGVFCEKMEDVKKIWFVLEVSKYFLSMSSTLSSSLRRLSAPYSYCCK